MSIKQLRRPRQSRVLLGVCAGIAERFDLDVSTVRVVAILLAIFGGAGVPLYGIAWLLMPDQDAPTWIAQNLVDGLGLQ